MKSLEMEKYAENACILFAKGYLDADLGALIVSRVQEAISLHVDIIVLSLAESPLINSLGMTRLIEAIELTQEADSELWFADLSPLHQKTLAASGVLQIVARTTTVAEAKKEFDSTWQKTST